MKKKSWTAKDYRKQAISHWGTEDRIPRWRLHYNLRWYIKKEKDV